MRSALLLIFKTISGLTAFGVFVSACLFLPLGATASPVPPEAIETKQVTTRGVATGVGATQTATQVYLPLVNNTPEPPPTPSEGSWPMAGGNPERTSWTATEVSGRLMPLWYKPFEPYILHRTQIIAEYGNLYIATSKGLYALDSDTGAEKWVYPTELPLGNSPTVKDGIVYVGGFDHKLHAVDARTGDGLWKFSASAGFDTNPVVVDDKVFAGNRDGYFYAIYSHGPSAGQLAWKYQTQGPIHFSAAYKDGVVYFASDDSHAYALNAQSGALVWKSAKLPGAGFHSWWPVVYRNVVIFAGSNNYRTSIGPGPASQLTEMELEDVYPNHKSTPKGTLVGPLGSAPGAWVAGTPTIDTSKSNAGSVPITEYFEDKPWRRTYFVLNRENGQEATYDFDKDGQPEYAPILWLGTHSGNRYPPIVGSDGVLYQGNNYKSDPTIAGGHISGWEIGTPYISLLNNGWNAVDEPLAYAAGGDLIYWNRCCDRISGAIDITIPEPNALQRGAPLDTEAPQRSWRYFSYNLPDKIPGYNEMTYVYEPYDSPFGGVFGGRNGSYGFHGDVNPPIPYAGMVFMHRSNAVIAFASGTRQTSKLPTAQIYESDNAGLSPLTDEQLKTQLKIQVEKILAAGHLRPGYMSSGVFDLGGSRTCGADLIDYWHNPADTLYTLLRALPYLPVSTQGQVRAYLQNEFSQFPPHKYDHIGWRDGAARETFKLPPEVEADLSNYGPEQGVFNFTGWSFNPFMFYALWKYAEEFGNAQSIFEASKAKLDDPPSNDVLLEMPHVHNVFIDGYWGYLELEKLAGYPESTNVRNELDRLLALRASQFSIELPELFFPATFSREAYCRSLSIARNFIYLTPELGDYLKTQAYNKVNDAVEDYTRMAPYWFVAFPETAFSEGVLNHYYDVNAIFQAKALILGESRQQLSRYLDVPGFQVGDLFYIDNLISLLEAD